MYTASIKEKTFFHGDFKAVVEFSNGTDKWTHEVSATSEPNFKAKIRSELVRLNELAALASTLPVGTYDPTEATPTPPTQAELDKQEWFRDFIRLERVKKLQEIGGMPASWATDLTALAAKVQANAKKAYIADM